MILLNAKPETAEGRAYRAACAVATAMERLRYAESLLPGVADLQEEVDYAKDMLGYVKRRLLARSDAAREMVEL